MGSIFHNAGMTVDALAILEASIQHNTGLSLNHYIMGHAYAVYGEFQLAVRHYNKSMILKTDFDMPFFYRHAVLCIEKVMDHFNIALT